MKNPLDFAISLSYQVGEILVDHFDGKGIDIERKPDKSIVTEYDLLADNMIKTSIQREFPIDSILSEELNSRLDFKSDVIWIVDPLDGTTNYSLGLRYWGISIACLKGGDIQCATAYFPLLDELYSAEHNGGAFLNSSRISTKGPDPEKPSAFFSCCSRTFRRYQVSVPYKTRILGSAVYSFCAVAKGLAVLGFEATPKIWDIAAGWLIVQEAGGALYALEATKPFPLSVDVDYSTVSYPTIIAATAEMIPTARAQIKPKNINSEDNNNTAHK